MQGDFSGFFPDSASARGKCGGRKSDFGAVFSGSHTSVAAEIPSVVRCGFKVVLSCKNAAHDTEKIVGVNAEFVGIKLDIVILAAIFA